MGLLRRTWTEARLLHHRGTLWAVPVLVLWALLLRAQEPTALRNVPFFWPGVEAVLLVALGLLPMGWVLARGPNAAAWVQRSSRRVSFQVLTSWGGITLYGSALAAGAASLSFTVDRLFGSPAGPAPWILFLEGILFLSPAAALAPAVGGLVLGLGTGWAVLIWLGLLATSLVTGLPVPTGSLLILQKADLTMAGFGSHTVVASVLATLAGMLVSTALATHQLRS